MNLIIKGDTSGVVEAIKGALQGLPQVGLGFGMLHFGVSSTACHAKASELPLLLWC
jgi:hypothetical protein